MKSDRRLKLVGWIARLAAVLPFSGAVVSAAPGGIIETPVVPPGFLFALESPPQSLKDVPVWRRPGCLFPMTRRVQIR
jgi:hypothetical protein